MSKINIMYKFIGMDKKVFASTDIDSAVSMTKHIVDADYADTTEFAHKNSGTSKFGIGGYYMFDYYLSNKIPDQVLESASQRWVDKIKETLSDYQQQHNKEYKYKCDDDTIKHVANIVAVHMHQCFDIIHGDEDLLGADNDKYIIFHMFIDRDLVNQFNVIKDNEDDPFNWWMLSTFIRDVFISGLETFNMLRESDEHDVRFKVCDIHDMQKVYVAKNEDMTTVSEEIPEYLS